MAKDPFENERLRRIAEEAQRAREQVQQILTPQTLQMLRAAREALRGMDLERIRAEAERARAEYRRLQTLYPAGVLEPLREQAQQIIQASEAFTQALEHADQFRWVREYAGQVFRQLPDLHVLREQIERAREGAARLHEKAEAGEDVLAAAGYGFVDHLFDVVFLANLADITPGIQALVVTKRLAAVTRGRDFAAALHDSFERSSLLPRRWPIVERALAAHMRRDYFVSVPLLLAQIEGAVNDLLVLKELAVVRKGKVYVRGPDGKVKENKKGEPIELRGLGTKIEHYRFREDELLVKATDLLLDRLIPNRNTILHGSNVRYARAKLSTQALLFLRVLVTVVVEAEHGAIDE